MGTTPMIMIRARGTEALKALNANPILPVNRDVVVGAAKGGGAKTAVGAKAVGVGGAPLPVNEVTMLGADGAKLEIKRNGLLQLSGAGNGGETVLPATKANVAKLGAKAGISKATLADGIAKAGLDGAGAMKPVAATMATGTPTAGAAGFKAAVGGTPSAGAAGFKTAVGGGAMTKAGAAAAKAAGAAGATAAAAPATGALSTLAGAGAAKSVAAGTIWAGTGWGLGLGLGLGAWGPATLVALSAAGVYAWRKGRHAEHAA